MSEKASFSNVDRNPSDYINYLKRIGDIPVIKRAKDLSFEFLDIQPGQFVIDVGSGLGTDVLRIARASGIVVGIDNSESMGKYAKDHTPSEMLSNGRVSFVTASAEELPVVSAKVDRYRAERVFQHLQDPLRAIQEAHRVLRPGGKVVIIDSDWSALRIDGGIEDSTELLIEAFNRNIQNPTMGKDMEGLLSESEQFTDIVDTFLAFEANSVDELLTLVRLDKLPATAFGERKLTHTQLADWITSLRIAEEQGRFSASFPIHIVHAKKQ